MPNIFFKNRYLIIVLFLAATHAAFTFVCYLYFKHYQLASSVVDLGHFNQQIWNFLHNGIPYTSINFPYRPINGMGFHFSPIILLIAPIYKFFPYLELFNLIQSVCLAITVIPIYKVWRFYGGDERYGVLWSLVFLLNSHILNTSFWDFHEQSIAVPVFAFAYLFAIEHKFKPFVLCMILLLATKEHFGLAVSGFGAMWYCLHKEKSRAGIVIILGLVSFAVIVGYFMPKVSGLKEHVMVAGDSGVLSRYGWLAWQGYNYLLICIVMAASFAMTYLLSLMMPFLWAGLAFPYMLMPGIADFLVNSLSINNMPRLIQAYHSCTLIVVAQLATMAVFANNDVIKRRTFASICIILVVTVAIALSYAPFAKLGSWQIKPVSLEEMVRNSEEIREINAIIGNNSPISAQSNIGSYFSSRREIYRFPVKYDSVEYIVLHMYLPFYTGNSGPFEDNIIDFGVLTKILENGWFGVVYWQDNWLVLQKGAPLDAKIKQEIATKIEELK